MESFPHGYTHDTRGDGATVLKRYRGHRAEAARDAELRALTRLAGGPVPVPAVLGAPPGALLTAHVPGVHGQDLIEAGHTAAILRECGRTLRLLPPGLVHGDYGPNNMLFDPVTFTTAAVLDWEWAHAGDPVEDLAWCEWIVRTHHPDRAGHLGALFAGYGERPAWSARHAAMLARCRTMLTPVRPGTERRRRYLAATAGWLDLGA